MTDEGALLAEIDGHVAGISGLAGELAATGNPLHGKVADTLRAFAEATRGVAAGSAPGFPPDLFSTTGIHLVLLNSYDFARRCLLSLLQVAGAFQNSGAHAVVADDLQALATRLVPALEALRGGVHPIVALAALLIGLDQESLVLDASATGQLGEALELLTEGGQAEAESGRDGLRLLSRHLAVRPGGEAAAGSLEKVLAGRP